MLVIIIIRIRRFVLCSLASKHERNTYLSSLIMPPFDCILLFSDHAYHSYVSTAILDFPIYYYMCIQIHMYIRIYVCVLARVTTFLRIL